MECVGIARVLVEPACRLQGLQSEVGGLCCDVSDAGRNYRKKGLGVFLDLELVLIVRERCEGIEG